MSEYLPIEDGLPQLQPAHTRCQAAVIVPARNEDATLAGTLEALRLQVDLKGRPLDATCYEVLLLLNNCTDASAQVARDYGERHPEFCLHVMERELTPEVAHVGTARRLLMDAAYARLHQRAGAAILSTDADTTVRPDWIARNLAALEAGADVVGGTIELFAEDFAALDEGTRQAYLHDRAMQRATAELEALLDPDEADPWPRHLEHFGASLACTTKIYAEAGGLPAVKPLEDVAFVDKLRKVGARIRHAPEVVISTSARLDGRAEVGLSGQLRLWHDEAVRGLPQMAESAAWLEHRFRWMGKLRRLNQDGATASLRGYPKPWRERIDGALRDCLPTSRFLEVIDCNGLIETMFRGRRHEEITAVLSRMDEAIRRSKPAAPEHRDETAAHADWLLTATPAD